MGEGAGGGAGEEEAGAEGEALAEDACCNLANRFIRIWGNIS